MKILVINCGSSSLKYQLIDMDNESIVAKGLCERIGIELQAGPISRQAKINMWLKAQCQKPHCSHQYGYGGFTGQRPRSYHKYR